MKKFFTMFGAAGLVAGMLMVGGCGSDHDAPPVAQGKVVKGPVVGATVKDANGVTVGTTDATGSFPLTGTAPYYSTGGTYVTLNADGTAGTAIAAPPMSTPAGVSQITPLSTLVNQATIAAAKPTATADEKADLLKLLAVIDANGGLSTDLSVKTTANSALLNLSETIGAVLASVATTSPTSLATAETAMIAAVTSLSATATNTTAAVLAAVSTELTLTLPTLATALNTVATTASTGTTAAPIGALPTPPASTGSTGSTGGTTVI
jgi:hypothetical protein